ncbi:hypothetical protein ABVT39_023798 [Epinephelus coioides]
MMRRKRIYLQSDICNFLLWRTLLMPSRIPQPLSDAADALMEGGDEVVAEVQIRVLRPDPAEMVSCEVIVSEGGDDETEAGIRIMLEI